MRSNTKFNNSQESCWPYPLNLATRFPRTLFSWWGAVLVYFESHISDNRSLKAAASLPSRPRGLSVLTSFLYKSNKKYFVSSIVFDKHCRPEFIKQVLPRFCRPHSPLEELFLNILSKSRPFKSFIESLEFYKSYNSLLFNGSSKSSSF
jgi:hypothetical protein